MSPQPKKGDLHWQSERRKPRNESLKWTLFNQKVSEPRWQTQVRPQAILSEVRHLGCHAAQSFVFLKIDDVRFISA